MHGAYIHMFAGQQALITLRATISPWAKTTYGNKMLRVNRLYYARYRVYKVSQDSRFCFARLIDHLPHGDA